MRWAYARACAISSRHKFPPSHTSSQQWPSITHFLACARTKAYAIACACTRSQALRRQQTQQSGCWMPQNTDAVVVNALIPLPLRGEQDGWRGGGYKRFQIGCCGRQVCDAELGRQVRWWEKEETGPQEVTGHSCRAAEACGPRAGDVGQGAGRGGMGAVAGWAGASPPTACAVSPPVSPVYTRV